MIDAKVPNESSGDLCRSLEELLKKVDGGLLPAIMEHVESTDFSIGKDCQDFLGVKNSLLLSYIIELTQKLLTQLDAEDQSSGDTIRLFEMKTILEKIRPLEKKMKYQLDKLLSENNSSEFATEEGQTDPLTFRPNSEAMQETESISERSEDYEEETKKIATTLDDEDVDDDLLAARKTLKLAVNMDNEKSNGSDLYRAPRLQSTPYPSDAVNEAEKQRRLHKKLRASELARTLREQYGEAPDQEDIHGGTDYGKQRDAARRLAEMEKEKIEYEEDNLVRLVTSRKQKKERKRLMREESSNLAAISDIGNIVRSVSAAFDEKPRIERDQDDLTSSGKRKKRRGGVEAKNHLQKELFGTHESSKKRNKKK
mmetsp:Transcript_15039/g.22942  ORF Transcript_15039/g.22942 Transcript_15039/m.22942 type:complete len:369 (-) Transcript_15039:227-1333(-)